MTSVRGVLSWNPHRHTTTDLIRDVALPAIVKVVHLGLDKVDQSSHVHVGDIMRIESVISQTRLLAAIHAEGGQRFISIPQSGSIKLKKKGKRTNVNKKLGPKDIVEKGKFPVIVQFRSKQPVRINDEEFDPKNIGHVDIQETIEEKFLRVNFIKSVAIGSEVVFLSAKLEMGLLLANGLCKREGDEWQQYQQMLTRACRRKTRISAPRRIYYISDVADNADNNSPKERELTTSEPGINHTKQIATVPNNNGHQRKLIEDYENTHPAIDLDDAYSQSDNDSVDLERMISELAQFQNCYESSSSSSSTASDDAQPSVDDGVMAPRWCFCC